MRRILFAGAVLAASVAIAFPMMRRWHHRVLVEREYHAAPLDMVFVPPGPCLVGSGEDAADPDEGPLREVFLPAFYIDRYEVTNAEFRRFDPAHDYAQGHDDYPATGISLERARAYAAWAGKRLPTAHEWEKAARGTDGRAYPWGSAFEPGRANLVDGAELAPAGAHPRSASPYGAEDMAGNAWEWVETVHRDSWLAGNGRIAREVIKGGAFSYGAHQGRASYNGFEPPGGTCNDVGFRCLKEAEPLSRADYLSPGFKNLKTTPAIPPPAKSAAR